MYEAATQSYKRQLDLYKIYMYAPLIEPTIIEDTWSVDMITCTGERSLHN